MDKELLPNINFEDYKFQTVCQSCHGTGKVTKIDTKRLGKLLKRLRIGSDITLRKISKEMKLSIGYINDLEQGRRAINHSIFMEYVFALDKCEQKQNSPKNLQIRENPNGAQT